MKAGKISGSAAVLLMLCAVCLMTACGKDRPTGTPVSVEYSTNYSGTDGDYTISYSISLPEGGVLGEDGVMFSVKNSSGGGYEYGCVLNGDVLSRAGYVIDEYSIGGWDGFDRKKSKKDTERGFSLTVEYLDGSQINASGSNAFPKNWDEGSQALSNFFEGLLDEETITGIGGTDITEDPESGRLQPSELFSYTLSGDFTAEISAYNGNGAEVEIPDDINGHIVSMIGVNAFAGSDVVSVGMGSYVTEIGESCFENCRLLREIQLPSGLSSLPRRAFAGCISLETASLPAMVRVIEPQVFANCGSLSGIGLNEGLMSIGSQAFADCTSLEELNIPYSVIYIADDAFSGCPGNLRLRVYPDSFGLEYAKRNNIDYEEYKIAGE